MHPTRRIRRITTGRHIKAHNGDPRPTPQLEQGLRYPLLDCAKSTVASCHGVVTSDTDTWPLHISRQADSLHPSPQFRCLQGSHPTGALKRTHAPRRQVQANRKTVRPYRGGVSKKNMLPPAGRGLCLHPGLRWIPLWDKRKWRSAAATTRHAGP